MPSYIVEAGLVSILFIGYVALWKIKQKSLLERIKIDPEVIYGDTRPTQILFSQLTRIMTISVIVLIILHGSNLSNIPGFYRIEFLNRAIFDYIGFSMGAFGLIICLVAQLQMGNAWRVGIDRKNKTELIRTGLYRLIRNPTYVGLFILSTGVWLIFPTMSFMLWGLTFYISLEFQVRLEEEFLTQTHGKEYLEYSHTTKRYFPFLY